MGLLSLLKNLRKKTNKEAKILVLGLDNSGKTTILKALSEEDQTSTQPTQGFNVKTLSQSGFKLNVWDIGGQQAIRQYWSNQTESVDGLVQVIDSSDTRRLTESGNELNQLLARDDLANVPLLVFANKQDLPTALKADDIREKLSLDDIESRTWVIKACSAMTQMGLKEGFTDFMKIIEEKDA